MGLLDRVLGRHEAPRIEVDDLSVTRYFHDGRLERVLWSELQRVEAICTPDLGSDERFFLVLYGPYGTGCVVSQAASAQVVERLEQLPGFDRPSLLQALHHPEDSRIECWRRAV
jgi:hypothetical protein